MRTHRSKRQQRKQRGSALLTSIVMIVMLTMLGAAMVDLGYMYGCKSRMQNAADAAALAAAMRVGNENTPETRADAQAWAANFANYNLPGMGDVLVPGDVVFGMWDPYSETFTPGGTTPNSVQVLVRRDGTNTDSVATSFMRIFGSEEIGLTTAATAMISPTSAVEGMPMALRAPDFGPIDPQVSAANPGKDGPSPPNNGDHFEVGDEVIVAIYGKGSHPPVHLTLDIDNPSEVMRILKGEADPIEMQVGDEAYVFNEGTGAANYIEAFDDRLDLPTEDPGRNIPMVIVETLWNSRDGNGELNGPVRMSDFVSVHLDEIVEVDVVDPKDPTKTITVRHLMGTITNKRAETSWGGATPSGAGGGSVSVAELVR